MGWTTIADGGSWGERRRRHRLSLDATTRQNPWTRSIDNVNLIQQVFRGRYDRQERYRMYDWMAQDRDVGRALDIIAEHCTETNKDHNYFEIDWRVETPTEEISEVLNFHLKQWHENCEWDRRLKTNIKNVLKYGDWFYLRHPKTLELFRVHPKHVTGAIVDRATNEILAWILRNYTFNIENMELRIDRKNLKDSIRNLSPTGIRNSKVIRAEHVIHLTLSEGRFAGTVRDDDPMDRYSNRWPFGESWLEQAYKVYKQRELLEDANIIHRVQRAPRRNVWYIDTGKTRPDRQTWLVDNFKREMNQSRIPQFVGQHMKTVDSVYNPISQLQDYYIPINFEQRGRKVEMLEGRPWDQTPDLDYFKKKFLAAMRVPWAWLMGPQEGGSVFNDGRRGVAYQEEIEFRRMCRFFHRLFCPDFDHEFKIYCKFRDVNVDVADFKLLFNPPTDYEQSKRLARLQEAIGVWTALREDPSIRKRWALIHSGVATQDDLLENERMWREENPSGQGMDVERGPSGGFGGGLPGPMDNSFANSPTGTTGMGEVGQAMGPQARMGDMSGGMAGGMAAMGAPGARAPAGMGESRQPRIVRPKLTEIAMIYGRNIPVYETITLDDIKPAQPKADMQDVEQTPDDQLLFAQDELVHRPIATLGMLRKLRHRQMARRIEQAKRMKMLQIIYKRPTGGSGGMF